MIAERRNGNRPHFIWDSDIPQWNRGQRNTGAGALFSGVVSGARGSPVGGCPGRDGVGSTGTFRGSWGVTAGERRLAEEDIAKPEEGKQAATER